MRHKLSAHLLMKALKLLLSLHKVQTSEKKNTPVMRTKRFYGFMSVSSLKNLIWESVGMELHLLKCPLKFIAFLLKSWRTVLEKGHHFLFFLNLSHRIRFWIVAFLLFS